METNTKVSASSVENQSSTQKNESDSSETSANQNKKKSPYDDSKPRITKDGLYMILALWMEDFVDKHPQSNLALKKLEEKRQTHYKNVGAVLVSSNDVVLAADCSRDGVHAVARLLTKHYDKAEGSKMFMSRKPCSLCAKLLVQSKVKRVSFLPLKPEYYLEYYRQPKTKSDQEAKEDNDRQMKQVDILFTANPIGQIRFVLRVEEPIVEEKKEKTPDQYENKVNELKMQFTENFEFQKGSEWIDSIEKELPWPVFNEMKEKVQQFFEDAMDWMVRVQVLSYSGWNPDFILAEDSEPSNSEGFNPAIDSHKKQAQHFMAMARFLAERTDDPTTGVGAVIVSPNMKIVAFGWNGYPLKAQYGEFARGGKEEAEKKYPYVIHAEQNALLMRNTKNIEGSILFVTKSPCHECAPLIAMEGIKTVVKDDNVSLSNAKKTKEMDYTVFPQMVKDGVFVCYQTKKIAEDSKDIEPTEEVAREIKFLK